MTNNRNEVTITSLTPHPKSFYFMQGGVWAQCGCCDRSGTRLREFHGRSAGIWSWTGEQREPPGGGRETDRVGWPRAFVVSLTNLHPCSNYKHVKLGWVTQHQLNPHGLTNIHVFFFLLCFLKMFFFPGPESGLNFLNPVKLNLVVELELSLEVNRNTCIL